MIIATPVPLTPEHELAGFSCGEPVLDSWLLRRARKNEASGASRTYVVCSGHSVVGYYSLAVGSIEHGFAPGSIRRNMPAPIPVMILARLAVDLRYKGRNIGTGMLRDAFLRTLKAAEIAGIRALLVHALHKQAANFYQERGFMPSPFDPLVLLLSLDRVRQHHMN